MPADPFASQTDAINDPSRAPFAVSPHDANPLPIVPKAFFIGTGGQLTLRGVDGAADVVFKNVASGQILDVRAAYVRATGTTAADIIALA